MFTIRDAHEPRWGHKSQKDVEKLRSGHTRQGQQKMYSGGQREPGCLRATLENYNLQNGVDSLETLVSVRLIIQSGPVVGKQKHFADDRTVIGSLSWENCLVVMHSPEVDGCLSRGMRRDRSTVYLSTTMGPSTNTAKPGQGRWLRLGWAAIKTAKGGKGGILLNEWLVFIALLLDWWI